jgi:hypothetical protein
MLRLGADVATGQGFDLTVHNVLDDLARCYIRTARATDTLAPDRRQVFLPVENAYLSAPALAYPCHCSWVSSEDEVFQYFEREQPHLASGLCPDPKKCRPNGPSRLRQV